MFKAKSLKTILGMSFITLFIVTAMVGVAFMGALHPSQHIRNDIPDNAHILVMSFDKNGKYQERGWVPIETVLEHSHEETEEVSTIEISYDCKETVMVAGQEEFKYPYNRAQWGKYPTGSSLGTDHTWALPEDNLNSYQVNVDHHVALKDAHLSGGCKWDEELKNDFANDLDNLNPTAKSFNSSKGSKTPDQLSGIASRVINTDTEKCAYATQHNDIKQKYNLLMTDSEQSTVDDWIARC